MSKFNLKQLKELGSEEMLFCQLQGLIAARLPLPKGEMPFYRAKDREIEAGMLVEDFIESGDVILNTITLEEDGKFRTEKKVRIVDGISKEKDITQGYEEQPGIAQQKKLGAHTLSGSDRDVLRKLSSIQFYRSNFCDDEYLRRVHEMIPIDPESREHEWKRMARFEVYRKEILKISKCYLTYKYDTRGRINAEAVKLEGLRPHGKSVESLAIEMSKRVLTPEGREVLLKLKDKYDNNNYNSNYNNNSNIIENIDTLDIRTPSIPNNNHNNYSNTIRSIEPLAIRKAEMSSIPNNNNHNNDNNDNNYNNNSNYKEGHEVLSYLRSKQINKALSSNSTGMLVEFDVTNSGLLIMGLCFKSPEMLMLANGYGSTELQDSHAKAAEVFGLKDRKEGKKINTPFLHGSSIKTITKSLEELTGISQTPDQVKSKLTNIYSEAANNPHLISDYGRRIVSNTRSHVTWDMPDGFKAMHRAYTECVPLELQLKTCKLRVLRDMPLLLDANNRPVYDQTHPRAKKPTKNSDGTSTKIMGLFANIIHSIDSYVLRLLINSDIKMLPKHDAFLIHPNDEALLRATLQDIYSKIFEMDLINNILSQIEETVGIEAPKLFMGNAENRMKESKLFLSME